MIDVKKRDEIASKAQQLCKELDKKAIEREELTRLITLAIFSRSHIFLIGVPGVGKTYIINIALRAVKGAKYFEYLVMSGTEPEELFGTKFVNEAGKLEYDIEHSVLDSHFVLLDEMFKGKSGILNSLLGVTSNERTFHMRGRGAITVPLQVLFGASNEFPADDALEPFDDRLLLRYEVERIKDPENYKRFLRGDFDRSKDISIEVTLEDIEYAGADSSFVEIPEEIVGIYNTLKQSIIADRIKVSDRKMITALNRILKMSAYLNKRDRVNYSDLFLLLHIAWREFTERQRLREVLFNTIFGDNRDIINILMKIEKALEEQERKLEAETGDFVYKRMQLDNRNIESEFRFHDEQFKMMHRSIAQLYKDIKEVDSYYRGALEVETQTRNNFLIPPIKQDVYRESEVEKMHDLSDRIEKIKFICDTFEENCRGDVYSYLAFRPGAHYAVV